MESQLIEERKVRSQQKLLPSRLDINTYFYAILEVMGDKGWGTNEAINMLFWAPALSLTIGWALGELWAPYFPHWEIILPILFATHFLTGVAIYALLSKNAVALDKEILKKRVVWTIVEAYLGAFCGLLLTILTIVLLIFTNSIELIAMNPSGLLLGFLCLGVFIYFGSVVLLYRKFPAYRIEGWVGLFELFLWTGFISVTGGCQSKFFYLYFLPLIGVFRRGVTEYDPSDPRYHPSISRRSERPSIISRLYDWHNHKWLSNVLYPFLWLAIAEITGAVLCVTLNCSGICSPDSIHGSWLTALGTNLGRFYLNGAPYLLILIVMGIMIEMETDSLRILGRLMKQKATEDWTRDLGAVVEELALVIKNNYMFNCSDILAITATASSTVEDIDDDSEKLFHINGITEMFQTIEIHDKKSDRLKGEEIDIPGDDFVTKETKRALENLLYSKKQQSKFPDHVFSDYFYNCSEPREKRRFRQLIEPLKEISSPVEEFLCGTKSLCYVVFPHPNRKKNEINSYTVVFFKSKIPGEFDANMTKLYEAIFTQVSGIVGKYEEFAEIQAEIKVMDEIKASAQRSDELRQTSENIADLAMTLTHDFKKQADRLYINLGKTKWMTKPPAQADKEWNSQLAAYLLYRRLSLVDEIARYTSPSEERNLFASIEGSSGKRYNLVLKTLAQACWLTAALAPATEDRSLNGGGQIIRGVSWDDIQQSPEQSLFDWRDILKAFFKEVGKDVIRITKDVAFNCADDSPVGESNITTDLWILVFHEIARNSLKSKVLSRRIEAYKENDTLVIEWTSYFEGGSEEARKSWGADKVNSFPATPGELSMPGKPSVPGPGWGQYGNYAVVEKILNQQYRVFWNLHPEQDQFSWTTQLKLKSRIINWNPPTDKSYANQKPVMALINNL